MDQDLTIEVARPLASVFACLADGTRLGTWFQPSTAWGHLEGVTAGSTEEPFVVQLGELEAVGEVIAHEPPRYVAFRVNTARSAYVLRITCTADIAGNTRVHIHQSGAEHLAIDTAALDHALHE